MCSPFLPAGTDPQKTHEILVIGAHRDHFGRQGWTCYFPGADDNASGTAVMAEVARVLAKAGTHTRRTILFISFSGEEQGLAGSRAVHGAPTSADHHDQSHDQHRSRRRWKRTAHGRRDRSWRRTSHWRLDRRQSAPTSWTCSDFSRVAITCPSKRQVSRPLRSSAVESTHTFINPPIQPTRSILKFYKPWLGMSLPSPGNWRMRNRTDPGARDKRP